MLNHIFYGMRDITLEYKETGVTANKTGEAINAGRICNVLVNVAGLVGDTTLSIKFEQSADGETWDEIGTFPIPDALHGVLFPNFKDYVRYQLIVGGTDPYMDVTLAF